MTDKELGQKIEMAAYLLQAASGGNAPWAREELGKVVREILTEGVRAVLDTPISTV